MVASFLKIVRADVRSNVELMVEYSDGTTAIYALEQLRKLTPQKRTKDEVGILEVTP
jgi:hypothetical protein